MATALLPKVASVEASRPSGRVATQMRPYEVPTHCCRHVSHSRALLPRCAHPLLATYPHPAWLPICLLPPSAYFLPPAYVLAHLPSLEIVNLSAYLPT